MASIISGRRSQTWSAGIRLNVRLALSLRVLPPRVAWFYWRAHRHAQRNDDRFSLASAARPAELAELLAVARDRTVVVELGTGTAWSAIALALDGGERRVLSYDPAVRDVRERYLDFAGPGVRSRIELRDDSDSSGPRDGEPLVELLFIDSSHDRESVLEAFRAWQNALAPGATVVFHDYGNPQYPGVAEAVALLGLSGEERGGLFVWRAAEPQSAGVSIISTP